MRREKEKSARYLTRHTKIIFTRGQKIYNCILLIMHSPFTLYCIVHELGAKLNHYIELKIC